jgi:ATP-binding cassette, subfamily G (WHITE), member 2, SNQ2
MDHSELSTPHEENNGNDPELPNAPKANAVGVHANEALHNVINHEPRSSPPPVYRDPHRARAQSSASRVGIDYFDPTGVQDLRRTLRRMSTSNTRGEVSQKPVSVHSPASETTLSVEDSPFDLEKTLRSIVKKWGFSR